MLSIRFPTDIENRLQHLAEVTGRSKTFYIKEAVMKHLDDMEDVFLADNALERFRASGEKTVSLNELERELGLAD